MAHAIQNPSDLFEHELKDIYDAESKLIDALGRLARETRDPVVRRAFEEHQKETREHARRLEQLFRMIGKEPDRGEGCAGIDGLLEEKRDFGRHKTTPEILAVFNLGAAAKTERYEISAYESLIELAEHLQMGEAVSLLRRTLEEEERALEKMRGFAQSAPEPRRALTA